MRLDYSEHREIGEWVPESETEKRDIEYLRQGFMPKRLYNWEEIGYKVSMTYTHEGFFRRWMDHRNKDLFKFIHLPLQPDYSGGSTAAILRPDNFDGDKVFGAGRSLIEGTIPIGEYKFLKDIGLRFQENETSKKFDSLLEKLNVLTEIGTNT